MCRQSVKRDGGSKIVIILNKHWFQENDISYKESKYQESIQSSTTPDPGYQWESDNFTIRHHKREPRGQHCQ